MSFSDDLRAFREKVLQRSRDVFVGATGDLHESVTEGSPVTGAPGQPVDTGNLKASWQQTFPEEWQSLVATNVEYAPAIEEGIQEPYTTADGTEVVPGPMTLRSEVGGFHSVKLTRAAWPRVVESVVRRVVAGEGS